MVRYADLRNVKLLSIILYYTWENGQVEAINKILINHIKTNKHKYKKLTWEIKLSYKLTNIHQRGNKNKMLYYTSNWIYNLIYYRDKMTYRFKILEYVSWSIEQLKRRKCNSFKKYHLTKWIDNWVIWQAGQKERIPNRGFSMENNLPMDTSNLNSRKRSPKRNHLLLLINYCQIMYI